MNIEEVDLAISAKVISGSKINLAFSKEIMNLRESINKTYQMLMESRLRSL